MAALAVILALLCASPAFGQNVTIRMRDGLSLKAVYTKAADGKKTVVMLHGWKSVKEEWEPLRKELESAGFGTLAYDSRTDGPRDRFVDDVGSVIQFLENEGVARGNVALAGASLGANVVLDYASLTNFSGPLIALSPGIEYQSLRTDSAIKRIKSPVLLVASQFDRYAFQTCLELHRLNAKTTLWTDVPAGHGVQMFDAALLARLRQWLASH